jgi:hypothetical protein
MTRRRVAPRQKIVSLRVEAVAEAVLSSSLAAKILLKMFSKKICLVLAVAVIAEGKQV